MGMIKGVKATLIIPSESGLLDDFGNPIMTETEVEVDNVLIAPVSADDMKGSTDMERYHDLVWIGIPKADDHNWEGAKVKALGKTYATIGGTIEGIEQMIPLDWRGKIMGHRNG